MESTVHIRMATADDLTAMLAIYAPFVQNTTISFEYEPPTLEEFATRFAEINRKFPWLAAEVDGVVCGYAYAKTVFSRSAYMWNAELSVYVADGFRRMKLGSRLVRAVIGLLARQGYYKAYAVVTALNLPSIRLMEQLGFEREGCFRNVGYKLDEWHDVLWLGKALRPLSAHLAKPLSCPELPPVMLRDLESWDDENAGVALSSGKPWGDTDADATR